MIDNGRYGGDLSMYKELSYSIRILKLWIISDFIRTTKKKFKSLWKLFILIEIKKIDKDVWFWVKIWPKTTTIMEK